MCLFVCFGVFNVCLAYCELNSFCIIFFLFICVYQAELMRRTNDIATAKSIYPACRVARIACSRHAAIYIQERERDKIQIR